MPRRNQWGLTLVEVLVALAILGMVAASVLALIGQNARFVAAAEEQALAGIVADNLIVESLATASLLERGSVEDQVVLGRRTWIYTRTVADSGVQGVVTLAVAVTRPTGGQVIARAMTLKAETK